MALGLALVLAACAPRGIGEQDVQELRDKLAVVEARLSSVEEAVQQMQTADEGERAVLVDDVLLALSEARQTLDEVDEVLKPPAQVDEMAPPAPPPGDIAPTPGF
jgi:pyrimidine operon attenuation protein/uracil phosphoribosyltransferase